MAKPFESLELNPHTVLDTSGTAPAVNRNLEGSEWDLQIGASSHHPFPRLIDVPRPEIIPSQEPSKDQL